jgi:hypothetical protein
MQAHDSGANHDARELGGCRSTSATRCRPEAKDGTNGWARLSATMEERERSWAACWIEPIEPRNVPA